MEFSGEFVDRDCGSKRHDFSATADENASEKVICPGISYFGRESDNNSTLFLHNRESRGNSTFRGSAITIFLESFFFFLIPFIFTLTIDVITMQGNSCFSFVVLKPTNKRHKSHLGKRLSECV